MRGCGETRDAVASLYPTATVTARFGADGITLCDPNRASGGAEKVFQKIYEKPI